MLGKAAAIDPVLIVDIRGSLNITDADVEEFVMEIIEEDDGYCF